MTASPVGAYSPHITVPSTVLNQQMTSPNEQAVLDEVEALKAIYGTAQISFRPRQSPTLPASISISLEPLLSQNPHRITGNISLAAQLPDAYPAEARPSRPTLRAEGLSAGRCQEIVCEVIGKMESENGAVCMFEYCEGMLGWLNEYDEEKGDCETGMAGSSHGRVPKEEGMELEERFTIFHGEPVTDRKSVFQAHAARVLSVADVEAVMAQLLGSSRKMASATHNTLAYRILQKEGMLVQDADDDGEKGAGKGILYVLQRLGVVNVLCVVSRWFGGTKLGPVRFRHINRVAGTVVEENVEEFDVLEKGMASRKR